MIDFCEVSGRFQRTYQRRCIHGYYYLKENLGLPRIFYIEYDKDFSFWLVTKSKIKGFFVKIK